jgi:hypothetical protein
LLSVAHQFSVMPVNSSLLRVLHAVAVVKGLLTVHNEA